MSPATFAPTPDYFELVRSLSDEQTPEHASVVLRSRLAVLRELDLNISQPPPFERMPTIRDIEEEIPDLVWPTVRQIELALEPLYARSEAEVNIDALREVMAGQLGGQAPQSPQLAEVQHLEGEIDLRDLLVPEPVPLMDALDIATRRDVTTKSILHALEQAPQTDEVLALGRMILERSRASQTGFQRIQAMREWRQTPVARELDRIEKTIAGLNPRALAAGSCTGHGDCEADVHFDCLAEWLTDAECAANVVPPDDMLIARQALTMWGEVPVS